MKFFKRKTFNFYKLETPDDLSEAQQNSPLIFKELTFNDLKSCEMAQDNNRMEKFSKRFDEGHKCYGHYNTENKKIYTYFWITTGQKAPFVFGVDTEISGQEIYIWDCRVEEIIRKNGLYSSGLKIIASIYADKMCLIVTETRNYASNRGILQAGFIKYKTKHFIECFGQILSWPPLMKYNKKNKIVIF